MNKNDVDEMDGNQIDAYMFWLQEINKKGSVGKQENNEITKQFMG